ncbi:hypothetical protein MTO96_013982 [Rhipicephalus appendiculatus]
MCRTTTEYVEQRLTARCRRSAVFKRSSEWGACAEMRRRTAARAYHVRSTLPLHGRRALSLRAFRNVASPGLRAARVPPSYGLHTRACLFGHAGPCFARQRDASRIGALKHEGHPCGHGPAERSLAESDERKKES